MPENYGPLVGQQSTLLAGISAGATTLSINGTGLGFPTAGNFKVLIDSEVLLVTAGQGSTTWTVTRAQDGTAGAAHVINAVVSWLGSHAQKVTAALTTDVQTFLPPLGSRALFMSVSGQAVFVTLDGTAPSSTNGMQVVTATAPVFLPVAGTVKVAPTAAVAATVNILWVA